MRSDVGKIVQKRILDVKLSVSEKRKGSVLGACFKEQRKIVILLTITVTEVAAILLENNL